MCVALVAVVAASVWLRLKSEALRAPPTVERAITPSSAASRTVASSSELPPTVRDAASAVAPTAGQRPIDAAQPEDQSFHVDTKGQLVKDARTRDELERMLSSDPSTFERRREEILDRLPPAAAREALDLLERFGNYRDALRQALPETSQALTQQDALVMLDTVHALRVSYFGKELTEAFFGAEEAMGRDTAQAIVNAGSDAR
jgi:hypothetical protein